MHTYTRPIRTRCPHWVAPSALVASLFILLGAVACGDSQDVKFSDPVTGTTSTPSLEWAPAIHQLISEDGFGPFLAGDSSAVTPAPLAILDLGASEAITSTRWFIPASDATTPAWVAIGNLKSVHGAGTSVPSPDKEPIITLPIRDRTFNIRYDQAFIVSDAPEITMMVHNTTGTIWRTTTDEARRIRQPLPGR